MARGTPLSTDQPADEVMPGLHVRALVDGSAAPLPAGRAEGPLPLLLVHGLADDGGCWPDAVARWADRPVSSVDLRGHGCSPRFAEDDLARPMERHGADIAEVLVALAAQDGPVVGVGHSMGAGALVVAALAGAPVAGLVLEDPRIAHPTTASRERLGRMRARELRAWQDDPDAGLADLRAAEPGWSEAEVRACAAARPLGDAAFLATGRTGLHGDDDLSVALVRQVADRVPTLLVTGDARGTVWTAPMVAALEGSPAQSAVVPGAGHCVRRDRPAGYHRVVDAFLASLTLRGPARAPRRAR